MQMLKRDIRFSGTKVNCGLTYWNCIDLFTPDLQVYDLLPYIIAVGKWFNYISYEKNEI